MCACLRFHCAVCVSELLLGLENAPVSVRVTVSAIVTGKVGVRLGLVDALVLKDRHSLHAGTPYLCLELMRHQQFLAFHPGFVRCCGHFCIGRGFTEGC